MQAFMKSCLLHGCCSRKGELELVSLLQRKTRERTRPGGVSFSHLACLGSLRAKGSATSIPRIMRHPVAVTEGFQMYPAYAPAYPRAAVESATSLLALLTQASRSENPAGSHDATLDN